MNLDSDDVIIDLSGADCNHPDNREDVHHDPPDLSGADCNHPNNSDEVIVDLSGIDDCKNSISGNHPNNREGVHDPDLGLRSRKGVAAKTNLITTSQPQQQVEEGTGGQLKTESGIIELAIPSSSNSQTDNSVSEILETPEATSSVTPGSHLMASRKKIKLLSVIEFSSFVCITLLFILRVHINKNSEKSWSSELCGWCGVGLATFSGRFGKHSEKPKMFCFCTLKTKILVIYWLKVIEVTWMFSPVDRVNRSNHIIMVLYFCIWMGNLSAPFVPLWISGNLTIEFLCAKFYAKRFNKRIQENGFHQYILQTLSGPPSRELSEVHSSTIVSCSGSNVFDVQTPQGIKRRMIKTASHTGFYTLPNTLDKSKDLMNPDEQTNRNITIEREAKAAGYLISKNVAKRGYIKEEDLLCFMNKEEVDIVLPLIGGEEESGRINEKSFFNWVVSMYMKGKFLEHSIDDITEVMKKLLKFFNVLLIGVIIIFWAILNDIASKEVMLFISSQFLLAVFTIGGSAKSTLESMIFLFVKYPFDVGDRCVIDGLQVVVEEVSILTTVFLKHDNQKISYPNSELATKSITNFSRSPEMRDIVEFDLDVSTSDENISALKAEIKTYIDSNPHLWQPEHRVHVREIEDMKMKMRLCITHTINFQNYEEISDKRSNLVLELRNIFRQLGIKCHIYPPTSSD